MSTSSSDTPHPLPARPSLRHLKDQAKDLVKSGAAPSLSEAQFTIARRYGFASWPRLQSRVLRSEAFHAAREANDVDRMRALIDDQVRELIETGDASSLSDAQAQVARLGGLESWADLQDGLRRLSARTSQVTTLGPEIQQLKRAIGSGDLDRVQALMTRHPELHRAPIGYGSNGPLTCVAECQPTPARLVIARWMIENGSDVHQGGDGPLMRAALSGERTPMMELLVSMGADVDALWDGRYPVIFAACEAVDPVSLGWLLEHGADPNAADPDGVSALDYVISSYVRSPHLAACIDALVAAGGQTKYARPGVLELLSGRIDRFAALISGNGELLSTRFDGLDFGTTGGRMLTLQGATLLHVAAEYRNLEAIDVLLDLGADVNARAAFSDGGLGGQTAVFHAVTQADAGGVSVARRLIDRGADLSVRARLPGHYERSSEVIECTPLGYALRFQETRSDSGMTVTLLRERGAPE